MRFLAPLLAKVLAPLACGWVYREEKRILCAGAPLTPLQLPDARRIGVAFPERVRVCAVTGVPPLHPVFWTAAAATGILSSGITGLSLRYGIYVHAEFRDDRRLIAHELVHTAQYERLGLRPFLEQYLLECLEPPGYPFGELEQEACRMQDEICP